MPLAEALLQELGYPVTEDNIVALEMWADDLLPEPKVKVYHSKYILKDL